MDGAEFQRAVQDDRGSLQAHESNHSPVDKARSGMDRIQWWPTDFEVSSIVSITSVIASLLT